MLVLSRKKNETIHIGDLIGITVLDIKGGKVTLGIAAPEALKILRGELLAALQCELSVDQAVDVETGDLIAVLPAGETSPIDPAPAASDVEAVS